MALTRALVVLLLALVAAGAARAEDDPRASPFAHGSWREVDEALLRADPVSRAAILLVAWEVVATNTLTRPAIDALPESSPLRRLPRDASPPKDVGPVADAWMRGQLQPLVDALKPGPDGKDALAKGRDRLAWLDHQLDRLPPVPTLAPLGPSRDAAKRALEALTLACAAEPDDVELARLLALVREPGDRWPWLAPLALVALGPARMERAAWLGLRGPVDAPLEALIGAWWIGEATASDTLEGIAAVGSRLPPGALRERVARQGTALAEADRAGWRPPDEAAWRALDPAGRLRCLDVALRIGAGPQRCPLGPEPRAPLPVGPMAELERWGTVIAQLEALGWAAVPLLLERADDEVAGPGAAARRLLGFYGGDLPTRAARAAWWARARAAGPRAAWEARPARARRELPEPFDTPAIEAYLTRAVRDLGADVAAVLGPEVVGAQRGLTVAERWIPVVLRLADRLEAPALVELLVSWQESPRPGVAWHAARTLGGRGDPRGLARLERLVAAALAGRAEGATFDPLGQVLAATELLVAHGEALDPRVAGALVAWCWRSPRLVEPLVARRERPGARDLLLRVAVTALAAGELDLARPALDALAPGEGDPFERAARSIAARPDRVVVRALALQLGEAGAPALGRAGIDARAELARDLLSADPARVDSAVAELGPGARVWLAGALRGEVAPLDSGGPIALRLGSASAPDTLPAPLAEAVRRWSARAWDVRDVAALLEAWSADPAAPPGLEVALARAPRGAIAAHVRPLRPGPAGTTTLVVDGLDGPHAPLDGPRSRAEQAEALSSALVDLLCAPDALVDLRLRVWR